MLNTLLRADDSADNRIGSTDTFCMCEPMGARGCAEWEVIPILARSEKHLHGERFMAGSCDDRIQRTMILALAIRHRMERPAISMEGGAMPMEQFAAAVCLTYEKNNSLFILEVFPWTNRPQNLSQKSRKKSYLFAVSQSL